MTSPLMMMLVALTAAHLLGELFTRLGLPRVVGQITAGIAIGITAIKPTIFTAENTQLLSFLANLGVILMFYYIGLKTDFQAFAKGAKSAVTISLFNTLIPFALTFLTLRHFFHFDVVSSAIIGIATSVSAQAISLDLLEELRIIRSRIGQRIIATGAIDDIIELLFIGILLSALRLATANFAHLLAEIAIFISIVTAARIWFVPATIRYFKTEKSGTARFTASIIVVLLIAALSEMLGIGALIGAIMAGIIVRQTLHKDRTLPELDTNDISKTIHTISFGFLIPLFFVWIGLATDLSSIAGNIWLITLLVLSSTIGTVGSTLLAVLLNKGSVHEGLLLGWGLNPKGDIELVIATLALKAGLLTQQLFTSVVVMSLATSVISAIVFKALVVKYGKGKQA